MKDASAAYIAKEEATQRQPAELYHFWRDGGEHWRYTSGDVTVSYDGHDYTPATLERSLVTYNSQLEVTELEIQAGYVENPVLEFISVNPVEILWVSVMKLHRDQDPIEVDVVFLGQIRNVPFKGASANIQCVGFEHFLRQTVPSWRYQLTCNHLIFDSKCTLLEADYKLTTTVTLDSTKTQLTDAAFSGEADGYYTGGKVVFGVEPRTIVAHVGSVVTLMYKFKELEDNDSIDAYPGCDGRIETCRDKFGNVVNHLGFSFIPVENPALRVSW